MKNLVLYLTINYPTRQTFFEILDVVEEFKIGYVEIGIPVADPYLDGAIVRESQEKVFPDLTMDEITSVLTEIRERYSFKIILMTYNEGVESFKLLPYVKKNTDLPVFVGFGVKDPEDIASILANGADGAIIGSEFIKRFNQGGIASLKAYLTEIRTVY